MEEGVDGPRHVSVLCYDSNRSGDGDARLVWVEPQYEADVKYHKQDLIDGKGMGPPAARIRKKLLGSASFAVQMFICLMTYEENLITIFLPREPGCLKPSILVIRLSPHNSLKIKVRTKQTYA
jgi:hypothetical protein